MSQTSAHSHRRALAPPAITRFQLQSASAADAVFSPPFVPVEGDYRYSMRGAAAPVAYRTAERQLHAVAALPPAPRPAALSAGEQSAARTWYMPPPAAEPRGEPASNHQAAGDEVPYLEGGGSTSADFPLDAFIVPRGVDTWPLGYAEDTARAVADHLEAIAQRIRTGGLESLVGAEPEALARALAAIVAGFLSARS